MTISFHILKKDLFLIFFLLLLFSLPFSIPINSAISIIVILLWLLQGKYLYRIRSIFKNRIFAASIVFYLFHLIGLFHTENFTEGFFILEKLLSFLIFPIVIGSPPFSESIKKREKQIFSTLIISYLYASICCLIVALQRTLLTQDFKSYNPHTWADEWHFLYTGLSSPLRLHPTYFSVHIVVVIFILIQLTLENWKSSKSKLKAIRVILITFFTIFLILLSARTLIASYFLILIFASVYIVLKTGNKKMSISLLGSIVLILAICSITPQIRDRFKEVTEFHYDISNPSWQGWSGTTIRFAEWKCSWHVIKQNILVGVGTGDGRDELMKSYNENNFIRGLDNRWNSHNQYFETWMKVGIFGLLSLIVLFLLSLALAIKSNNFVYLFFIIIFLLASLTESIFATQKGIVFFGVLNSFFAVNSNLKEQLSLSVRKC